MRIEDDIKLDFKDVLIRPRRSTLHSREQVNVEREYKFLNAETESWKGVPIIVSNMDTVGTFEVAIELTKHKFITAIHKHYTVDAWKEFLKTHPEVVNNIAVSAGVSDEDFNNIKVLLTLYTDIKFICLDVANGYSERFVECCKKYRTHFPDKVIIAGNVVTQEMVEELLLQGKVDIVKIGIGPGSVCTTRKKTGVGYPQLSAIIECADSAHGLGGLIIADGGIKNPGDFAKAFGAGADFAMAGGIFSGTIESAGEVITLKDGKKMKEFYGMSSAKAMKKHAGSVAEYRSSEGKSILVPFKDCSVNDVALDIKGGLRSACTYVGASQLKDLSKRTCFIRVTQQTNEVFSNHPQMNDKR